MFPIMTQPTWYTTQGLDPQTSWRVAAQNPYGGQQPGPCVRPFPDYYIPPWQPFLSYLPSTPAWWNVSKSVAAATTNLYGVPPPTSHACVKSPSYQHDERHNSIGPNHACENDCQCSGLRICYKPNGAFGTCVDPGAVGQTASLLTPPNVRGSPV